jgi:hypothetical protein
VDPARSGNHGMYGTFMRENREIPRSPTGLITGRVAQGTRVGTPEMHERGKSDRLVVPANPPNKAVAAEVGEGRVVNTNAGWETSKVVVFMDCGAVWKMEVAWPSGVALRKGAPNRHEGRWLKTVVLSVVEKARR